MHKPVQDGFARYTFDSARSRSQLAQLGWTAGEDGILVGAGGERFVVPLWTTEGADRVVMAEVS